MSPALIQVQNLTFGYDRLSVLSDITVDLAFGQSVAILGPNGSGKSTFLRCLSGGLQPDRGEVRVDGLSTADPSHTIDIRRRVGLLFQNPDDQIVSAIVEDDIAFGLENLGVPHAEMTARVGEALERFNLTKLRGRPSHDLSGGERQRLALAGVWVTRPRFLLLDEPTALLDPLARHRSLQIIFDLVPAGVTPIVVTHDPDDAARADRLLVLSDGKIVEDGTPSHLLANASRLTQHGLDTTMPGRIARRLGRQDPLPVEAGDFASSFTNTVLSPKTSPTKRPPTRAVIEATGLSHVYNLGQPLETCALDGIDLSIEEGEWVAIVGPSGSGKSTFALHLNALLQPTAGSLSVLGNPTAPLSKRDALQLRRDVGLIFQFPESQLFAESVASDVAFGPRNLEMDKIEDRVDRALEQVGLSPETYRERNPLTLSGGEKRRIAIAGVLVTSPRILVLDEPTAALDPAATDDFEELLYGLQSQDVTILMITHDLDRAASTCDRIIAFNDGRVAFTESPHTAFDDHARLESLGLIPPSAARLADELRTAGLALPEGISTEAQIVAALGGPSENG